MDRPAAQSWYIAPGVLLAGLLLACCAAAPPQSPTLEDVDPAPKKAPAEQPAQEAADADPARQAAEPGVVDCTTLDELGCLDSVDCTLRQRVDKSYACTRAASDCERGFLQRAGRREDCAAGCSYSPAQCYCSPDITCVCGGGPPALCQAAD